MKLPVTVVISGVTYQVKKDKKDYGGKFDAGKQTITIGTKGKSDYQFQVFIHETIEAILTEKNYRFQLSDYKDNEHFRFFFTHDEFDNICKDIALALKGIIKT